MLGCRRRHEAVEPLGSGNVGVHVVGRMNVQYWTDGKESNGERSGSHVKSCKKFGSLVAASESRRWR